MVATTGYQAGIESNDVVLSYAQEAVYGILPAVQFQQLRLTGESLAGSKTRARPGEILTTGEVAAATTNQETATGNVNFALSYGTFDDLIAGALKSDWSAALTVNGAAADMTLSAGAVNSVRSLTCTTAKFAGIVVGAWIRIGGFTINATANGYVRVLSNTGTALTFLLAPSTVAETPAGAAAQVRSSGMTNGTTFKSFHFQKKLSSNLFLRYPGSFVSDFQLSGSAGNFLSGSFTLMSQSENQFTVDASTGGVLPPPYGRVHDPVGGFNGVYLDGLPIAAVVDSFQINASATNAKQEYGMGSAAAQGQIAGLLEAKGTLKVYFRDFGIYSRYKTEAQGALAFVTRDPAGNAYAITIPAATLMNPSVVAGGPSTAVMASFSIEGNPQTGGGSIQVDRLPAA